MNIYEYKTKVQFLDVTEHNQLSKRGLLRILGEAAGLHSDLAGYGLNQMDKTHLTWMLLNWKVQTFSNPIWNTELTVKTWPRNFNRFFSQRDFEVYDNNNQLVALASSKWVLIDCETSSLTKISPKMLEDYGGVYNKSVFDEEINEKEHEPEKSVFVYEYQVKKRDLDTNHHVNNLYYLDYAYDALPEEYWNNDFKNLEIIYKKQIKYGANIKCFYFFDQISKRHIITIKSDDLKTVHAIIKLF